MYKFCGLVRDRLYDLGMAMTGRADSDAGVAIQKNVAVRIFDPNAVALFGYEFIIRTWVARSDVFCVSSDDLSAFGPGNSVLMTGRCNSVDGVMVFLQSV